MITKVRSDNEKLATRTGLAVPKWISALQHAIQFGIIIILLYNYLIALMAYSTDGTGSYVDYMDFWTS